MFRYIVVVAMAGVLLAGCASSGVRVDENKLQGLVKGKTTYQQVLIQLGPPTSNTLLPNGQRMIMYTYAQVKARPESFIPLIGAFVGGSDIRSNNVMLTFDARGVLDQLSSTQSQLGTGTGLAAH